MTATSGAVEVAYTVCMASRNTPDQVKFPSLTHWLEETLAAMPPRGRMTLKLPHDLAFGFTDDRKTEKGNQDRVAFAYRLDPSHYGESWFFAGLCDGVGGEERGDIAASIAMAEILSELCSSDENSPRARISDAIVRAHSAVGERLHGSATTFAGVLVTARGTMTLGSVGDSRIYSLAQGKAQQLSQDDTLEDMLRRHPSSTNDGQVQEALQNLKQQWKDSLGQAIGGSLPLEPRIKDWPTDTKQAGCLLCTDGVWKTVENVLDQTVAASGDRQDLARRLLNLTDLLRANDNATAVVLPEVSNVIAWLRNKHSLAERGLVHIVLPTEALVAPWTLFEKRLSLPAGTRQAVVDHPPSETPAKSKSKRKQKNGKPSVIEKDPEVQLTIEEEVRDEPVNTTGPVSKERKGST